MPGHVPPSRARYGHLSSNPDVTAPPPQHTASPEVYADSLAAYLHTRGEDALYRASLLSRAFVEEGLGPEEIVALHGEAFAQSIVGLSYRDQARAASDGVQFLLEVMIAYGIQHKEYLELKVIERARAVESRAEEDRRRLVQAEQTVQQSSEALAMIAHELRTPISAALGNLDLAMRALRRGDVERVPRLVGSARDAIERLSRLSGDLVEASRGQTTRLELVPLELAVVLAQASAWAAAVADQKGVSMVRGGGPFSIRVLGDQDALLTVFGNLLSNAIRYTPEGGTVTVRHGLEGEQAWVEVQDTGIGITAEAQDRLFEQFYRAPEARVLESSGLGLGLTLVQRLVQAHGGQVGVQSSPGDGATFRVTLPVLKSTTTPKEEDVHGGAAD